MIQKSISAKEFNIKKTINSILGRLGFYIVKKDTISALKSEKNFNSLVNQLQIELIKHQTFSRWSTIDKFQNAEESYQRCFLCETNFEKLDSLKYRSYCIFGGGELVRHKCPSCGLIMGPKKMLDLSEEALSEEYHWHYRCYTEGDSTEQEIRAFYSLNPSKEGVYLNYGAGNWSQSIKVLRSQGWNVYGYEPHASESKEEFIIKNKSELNEIKFNGLYSNNLLEHLRYPVEDLKEMLKLLKPGGYMAHATPCFEYLYEFTRFHLFFFTDNSKNILFEKAGLQVVSYEKDGHFMNLLAKRL